MTAGPSQLVLSVFPGIGPGFCVVRGPDAWWGGDIRKFHAVRSHFTGIIGGPPCEQRRRDAITPAASQLELT